MELILGDSPQLSSGQLGAGNLAQLCAHHCLLTSVPGHQPLGLAPYPDPDLGKLQNRSSRVWVEVPAFLGCQMNTSGSYKYLPPLS